MEDETNTVVLSHHQSKTALLIHLLPDPHRLSREGYSQKIKMRRLFQPNRKATTVSSLGDLWRYSLSVGNFFAMN
jgi:hypothetical protein